MMRGHEILSSIAWSGDVHPDTIAQIEQAFLNLDRKAHGTNRPTYNSMEVHRRMTAYINERGGYRKAAGSLLYDMHCGTRPVIAAVLHSLGLRKSIKEIYTHID